MPNATENRYCKWNVSKADNRHPNKEFKIFQKTLMNLPSPSTKTKALYNKLYQSRRERLKGF